MGNLEEIGNERNFALKGTPLLKLFYVNFGANFLRFELSILFFIWSYFSKFEYI